MTDRLRPFAVLEEVSPVVARSVVEWIQGAGGDANLARGLVARCGAPAWVLAHCDDGVAWGAYRAGCFAFSDLAEWPTPRPAASTLQQVRLFGPAAEILIWSEGRGSFAGRLLEDTAGSSTNTDPARPHDEAYLVAASQRVAGTATFTAVRDRSGRVQVVPLPLDDADFLEGRHGLELGVRHYMEPVAETGCIRIAASRLVALRRSPVRRA